ncbi:MAG: lipoprotein [Steroidobacteraceae bacterium]
MRMRRAATLLLSAALLTGCGQKGPLFIPDKTGEAVGTVTPAAAPASSPVDADAAERARQEAARRAAGN